jgi:selenium metabolism protein YedF
MEYIDLKGMSCPLPVVETKRLIEAGSIEELEVSLDQGPARENVTRFLESRGYRVSVESDLVDSVILRATKVGGIENAEELAQTKIVVLVDGVTVGRGDELLGSVLMKSFLHTLKEIEPRPWRLIFLNAGVRLASEGSDLIALLKELEDLGVEILSCGTCLDFFKLKEKLVVGRVTNMYDIVSSLVAATTVLRP